MRNPFLAPALKTHRLYAPSSMARILVCLGSIGEGENDRDKSSTDAADEGQVGHDIFESCMKDGGSAERFIGRRMVPSDGANFVLEVDTYFARAVDLALGHARSLLTPVQDPGAGAVHSFLEHGVALKGYEDLCAGTADLFVLRSMYLSTGRPGFRLDGFDLKMGMLEVNAEANAQVYTYLVMFLDTYALWDHVEFVGVHIAQPRQFFGDKIKSVDVHVNDLRAFRDTIVRTIEAGQSGNRPFVAGPHCRYCGRLGMCDASRDMLENLVRIVGADPAALRSDMLGWVLDHKKVFESFVKRAESIMKDRALRGEDIGRPLVMTRKHRQWKDPVAAARAIVHMFGVEALEAPTPAQLEERNPERKAEAAALTRELSFTPKGDPTVGKPGDNRTAFTRPTLADVWSTYSP